MSLAAAMPSAIRYEEIKPAWRAKAAWRAMELWENDGNMMGK